MHTITKSLFLQVFLTIVFCTSLNAQNLIDNSGFEEGLTGWSNNMNNGAGANFTIETTNSPDGSKHLKCEILKLGSNDWDVQLRSNDFVVDETHQYRLSFKAKTDKPEALVKVYIQKTEWMGKEFSISDSWKEFTYIFTPNESVKQLKFNFVELSNYYLDNIVIEDITAINSNFNTPPSCVITTPHVNAYYRKGTAVTIKAYATDIGGSGADGEVAKVEFFIDNNKIGESSNAQNNSYSYHWNADKVGTYIIKAIATDTLGKKVTAAAVPVSVGLSNTKTIGLSAGKGKYLGNVVRNSGAEPSFTNYWNAVTSGNGGKWSTVERNRDVMKWEVGDNAYNLATYNNLPYRYHTLAWGSQYPNWIKTLNPNDFQAEMEEFIKAVADRYPYIDQIDVLNEPLPGHQDDTKYFIDGLGGTGESGYDWAVWLFKKARKYFPNSKLVLNDFSMLNSTNNIREQLLLLKVLRDSALVDGFGAQAHTFSLDKMEPHKLKQNLDLMATAGVPVYITEMDMQGVDTNEASQLKSYETLFPVLWEHPDVAGITLWGYIYGNMWKPDAGLVYENGSERSSMVWLKNYMENQEDVGYPSSSDFSTFSDYKTPVYNTVIEIYPNPSNGKVILSNRSTNKEFIRIYNIFGQLVNRIELYANSSEVLQLSTGIYLANINNQKSIKFLVNN